MKCYDEKTLTKPVLYLDLYLRRPRAAVPLLRAALGASQTGLSPSETSKQALCN